MDIREELAAVVAELALTLRHLPGKHNQKTHGSRYGGYSTTKESLRRLKGDKAARERYKARARKRKKNQPKKKSFNDLDNKQKIDVLKKIGGSEWQKGDKHRIYFNNLGELYGLKTWRYKTGNISGAQLDGRNISNSQAKKILEKIVSSKMWFDVKDGKFWQQGPDWGLKKDDWAKIRTNLNKQIEDAI